MDLSPKLLTDIQFREQWRGYNPEEVDEFLERVASGLEEMQQRLNDALERASNAERRLLERNDDDEIRRTLVLAQRTAVASMEEARIEADRLVSETEERCRSLVTDAEAAAAQLEAETASRRQAELGDLAEQRSALQRDVDSLGAYLDREQTRMADLLGEQIAGLTSGYALDDAPPLSDVTVPAAHRAPVAVTASDSTGDEADAVDASARPELPEAMSPVDDLRRAREGLADALRLAGVDAEVTDAPVEPAWRDGTDDDGDDDPFLAELRRAVGDTEPLGPRDHRPEALELDRSADEVATGGFLRRRRKG